MKFPSAVYIISLVLGISVTTCMGQNTQALKTDRIVGGACEGCEALFEYGEKKLTNIDTLPGYKIQNPKLVINGTVYQKDGKTAASDIIIYLYHTDRKGVYPTKGDETGWARRHGFIRGWVKTDASGKFTFYTFRPASYPNRQAPEHVHITIKEPGLSPYYIDDIMFIDDPLLTDGVKAGQDNRAGPGIVKPSNRNGTLYIKRDIILGQNIPDYN